VNLSFHNAGAHVRARVPPGICLQSRGLKIAVKNPEAQLVYCLSSRNFNQ